MINHKGFSHIYLIFYSSLLLTQSSETIGNQQKQIKKSAEDSLNHPAYFDVVTTEDIHNSSQKTQQSNDLKPGNQEVILESKKENTNEITNHEYSRGSHSISRRIRITYEDRQGNITSRLVKVDSFDNHACSGSFFAYCYSRKDYRTFRFDGVIECVNEDTGEYINDIQKYLNNEYEISPQKKESEILKKYQNIFDVFIYVAKADGQFRREEKAIILDFFANFVMDEMLTESVIEKTFKNIQIPSKKSYKYALKSVFFEHNDIFPEICRCCHEIVNTQKKITPEEEEALEIIEIVIQEEINRENKHKRKTNK